MTFTIISVMTAMIFTSVLFSSMGTKLVQEQSEGMLGVTSSPQSEQAAIALPLFTTYSGRYGYVAAGIGVRNTGRGTISVRVPRGTSLTAAWLYWVVLDSTTTPNPNKNKITVNGILVTGTQIGTGPNPCWYGTGYTYRASVSTALYATEGTGGISYGLEIGGMASATINGESPWIAAGSLPMAESVHLILVYTSSTLPLSVIKIYNGYYEQTGGTATFAYTWPARTSGAAIFSHLTSDGQNLGNFLKSVKLTVGTTTTTIESGTTLNGKDPSLTSRATFQGSLADTDTYVVSSLVPLAGGASTITYALSFDCIVWSALVFATGM